MRRCPTMSLVVSMVTRDSSALVAATLNWCPTKRSSAEMASIWSWEPFTVIRGAGFCKALGRADLLEDKRFEENWDRVAHRAS